MGNAFRLSCVDKMNIKNTDEKILTLTAARADVLDLCKMIDLAAHIDPVILNVDEQVRSRLLQQFMIFSGEPKDTVTFRLALDELHDLSQILEGVNVVDTDDIFDKGTRNIPADHRMQSLTENVTGLYEQLYEQFRVSFQ